MSHLDNRSGVLQWISQDTQKGPSNTKHCSKCNTVIVDEIKADPFFTGIYKCPSCKNQKRQCISPPTVSRKLPSIQTCMYSEIRPLQYLPSPIPTPVPSPKAFPDSKNKLSFYIQQFQANSKQFVPPHRMVTPVPASPVTRPLMVQGHSSIAKPIPQSAMVRPHPSTIAKPTPQSFEAFVMERFKRNEKEVGDRSYITQYELCKNCHGLNTSGVVVTDKGDKICRKCFKASSVTKTAATRVCNKCKTDQTSKWYTDRLAVGHICKACYTKRRTCPKFDGLEVERRCTQCTTNHSSLWYQDHFTANGYICIECHDTRKKPKK